MGETRRMPKIIHLRENCIGCNTCIEYDPTHWKLDESDGKMTLVGGRKNGETYVLPITLVDLEKAELAARDCPVKIIKVIKK